MGHPHVRKQSLGEDKELSCDHQEVVEWDVDPSLVS